MSAIPNPAQFALAGNAVFTVTSRKTETRFTFKVRVAENNASMHFVSVLTGPDNTTDYRYLGYIRRGVYFHGGAKAKIAAEAPSAKAFDWLWRNLMRTNDLSDLATIDHCGRCGRCGRPLTVPESVRSGYGPECVGKVL